MSRRSFFLLTSWLIVTGTARADAPTPREPIWPVFAGHLVPEDASGRGPDEGTKVRVFDRKGERCTATLGEYDLIHAETLDRDLAAGSRGAPRLRRSTGSCRGGLFALPIDASKPRFYRASVPDAALKKAALAAARAHPTWRREQLELDARTRSDAASWDLHVDISTIANDADDPVAVAKHRRKQQQITIERLRAKDDELVRVSADWSQGERFGGGATIILRVTRKGGLRLEPIASLHDARVDVALDLESDGRPELVRMLDCADAIERMFRWDEALPALDGMEERDQNDRRRTLLIESPLACARAW